MTKMDSTQGRHLMGLCESIGLEPEDLFSYRVYRRDG